MAFRAGFGSSNPQFVTGQSTNALSISDLGGLGAGLGPKVLAPRRLPGEANGVTPNWSKHERSGDHPPNTCRSCQRGGSCDA